MSSDRTLTYSISEGVHHGGSINSVSVIGISDLQSLDLQAIAIQ